MFAELLLILWLKPAVERPVFRPEDIVTIRAGRERLRAKINAGRDLAPAPTEAKTKGLH